jgi:hypothetical protein
MKRTIKLTESDLSRIVKRVIKEEDEMEDMGISIKLGDVFDQVMESLDDMGGYDDSMEKAAMDLAKDIMSNFQYDLPVVLANYIADNYEGYLHEILDNEGYDEDYNNDDEY